MLKLFSFPSPSSSIFFVVILLTLNMTLTSSAHADCADGTAFCFVGLDQAGQPIGDPVGNVPYGKCWEWQSMSCVICKNEPTRLVETCQAKYPSCGNHCVACTSVNIIGSKDPTICY